MQQGGESYLTVLIGKGKATLIQVMEVRFVVAKYVHPHECVTKYTMFTVTWTTTYFYLWC